MILSSRDFENENWMPKEWPVVYIKHNNLTAGTRTFKPGTKSEELVSELNV